MFITPKSQQLYDKNDADLFPALKLFLPLDEGSGYSPIDAVSGGSIAMFDQRTFIDVYSDRYEFLSGVGVNLKALPNEITVGANRCLMTMIGHGATVGTLTFKDSSNNDLMQFNVSGTHKVQTAQGNSTPSITAWAAGDTRGHGVQFIPGTSGEGNAYQTSAAAVVTPVAEDGTFNLTTMESLHNLTISAAVSPIVAYSLMIWVFQNYTPSDDEVNAALAWMLHHHSNGNKYIYPGWRGVT